LGKPFATRSILAIGDHDMRIVLLSQDRHILLDGLTPDITYDISDE